MTHDEAGAQVVTLAEFLAASSGPAPVWSTMSDDLNVNLISFTTGQGVPEHINDEVDVLLLAVHGEGVLSVDGVSQTMRAGQVCLVPKGASRSIHSGPEAFAYVTCHRL